MLNTKIENICRIYIIFVGGNPKSECMWKKSRIVLTCKSYLSFAKNNILYNRETTQSANIAVKTD